jgi:ornithine cyclodeaminase/alanine dehydrogenase-like protein (mu-crystallin family)
MFREGRIEASHIHANIGQKINGDRPGRETDDERFFFCPLGLGREDVAVAIEIYR